MARRATIRSVTKAKGRPGLAPADAKRVREAMQKLYAEKFEENKTALGQALGISQPAVTQLLDGTNSASLRTAKMVAKVMGVGVASLVHELSDAILDATEEAEITVGRYPSKRDAAEAARLLGLNPSAIALMLDMSGPADDPGALYWFKKAELFTELFAANDGSETPSEMLERLKRSGRELATNCRRRARRSGVPRSQRRSNHFLHVVAVRASAPPVFVLLVAASIAPSPRR